METNRDSVNFSCSSISEVTELGFIESNSDLLNVKFCLSQPHFYKAKGYMKILRIQVCGGFTAELQDSSAGTEHASRNKASN